MISKNKIWSIVLLVAFIGIMFSITVKENYSASESNEVLTVKEKEKESKDAIEKKPQVEESKLKIGLMGDICFGSNFGKQNGFYSEFQNKGSRYFLDGMRPKLDEMDLRIANLENVFTDSSNYQPGKIYTYKAYRKEYVNVLVDNKIDYVNVVNNHMTDYRQSGFDETLQVLEKKGIHYFGTNKKNSSNVEIGSIRVNKNRIFEKKGIKIGMMGYLGFNSSYPSKETIQANIDYFKSQKVDFIIASLHGGGQNTTEVTSKQIQLAHQLIDLGADMVYGHHPHILQRTEIYKNKKIYYSLN